MDVRLGRLEVHTLVGVGSKKREAFLGRWALARTLASIRNCGHLSP